MTQEESLILLQAELKQAREEIARLTHDLVATQSELSRERKAAKTVLALLESIRDELRAVRIVAGSPS